MLLVVLEALVNSDARKEASPSIHTTSGVPVASEEKLKAHVLPPTVEVYTVGGVEVPTAILIVFPIPPGVTPSSVYTEPETVSA